MENMNPSERQFEQLMRDTRSKMDLILKFWPGSTLELVAIGGLNEDQFDEAALPIARHPKRIVKLRKWEQPSKPKLIYTGIMAAPQENDGEE